MGQTIQLPQTGEKLFIPRYRVTVGFSMLPNTTKVYTVAGNEKLHKFGTPKEQVLQAVRQAQVLVSLDFDLARGLGEKVLKVEREWESEKGWEEIVTAQRAVPGTKITIWSVSANHDGHGVRPYFANVTVGRWHGLGDGTAALIDDKGQHCGIYERDDVFAIW